MTMLERASHQWSSRLPDERYGSIEAMHAEAVRLRNMARTSTVQPQTLRVGYENGETNKVYLEGSTGARADLTHWSFGQLAGHAEAPAAYVRTLPAKLASECLNDGLARRYGENEGRKLSLLFTQNGALTLRALNSERYTRIWNADITARLVALKAAGPWQEAPAAFDSSRGQYMSDRDMFSFFVDNNRRIFETKNGGLSRGFFAWNSEVGAATFGIMTFLYEYVCGNHRVWGASEIRELRIRHIGDADQRYFSAMKARLIDYAEGSAAEDEMKIKQCLDFEIAGTKDEVIDQVFNTTGRIVPRKTITLAYAKAEEHEDWYGSPRSAWGMAGGLTEIARDLPNTDERVALDKLSTRVMEMAF
jgi:hypothetical protein